MRLFHLLVLSLLVASAHADDWPHWRGPFHDGISREKGLLTSWPDKGPTILWETSLTGGYSTVVVAQGRVFTQALDDKHETVLCFDAATGKKLWEHRYLADYAPFKDKLDQRFLGGPRATPAVDEGRVYAIGTLGDLYCLDAATGKKIWHVELQKLAPRPMPDFGYCSSPFIVGDRLFLHPGAPNGFSLAALDKRDGSLLWKALDDRMGWATPIHYEFEGQRQLVYFTAEGAVAVTPDAGKLLWRHGWLTEYELNVATPIHDKGRVFISSNYGRGGALLKLRKDADPTVVWKANTMTNHFSTSVLYEGHLYGFSNFRLRCVNFETGKMKWDLGELGRGTVLVADGLLFAMGEHGELVLLEAGPKLVEKSRFAAFDEKSWCWAAPVLSEGRLILRHEHKLLALQVRKE